jgi:hypothetical protein
MFPEIHRQRQIRAVADNGDASSKTSRHIGELWIYFGFWIGGTDLGLGHWITTLSGAVGRARNRDDI